LQLLDVWQQQRTSIDQQQQQNRGQERTVVDATAAGVSLEPARTVDGVLAAQYYELLLDKQGFPEGWEDFFAGTDLEALASDSSHVQTLSIVLTWVACEATLLPNLSRGGTAERQCLTTAARLCEGSLARFFPALHQLLRDGVEGWGLQTHCVIVMPRALGGYLEVSVLTIFSIITAEIHLLQGQGAALLTCLKGTCYNVSPIPALLHTSTQASHLQELHARYSACMCSAFLLKVITNKPV
jgi:hypothetical protein